MRLYLSLLILFACTLARAQTSGSIENPDFLPNPMNPNGDAWITTTGAAFTGPLDEAEFELPFVPIPEYEPEPVPDNQVPSTSCTKYELVGDATNGAESTYYYWQDPDGIPDNGDERIFFRFRVARVQNNSVGLSILIDTDNKFGFSGPDADPNAVVGNPGFELEILAITSSGAQIEVYNVDGVSSSGILNSSYSVDTNMQVAYALNQDPDCSNRVPGFIDIYLPFSALGLSSTAQVRMVGAASELAGSALGGNASDIAGVDGTVILDDDDQFIAAIESYPPFTFQPITNNEAPVATDATPFLNEGSANGTTVHTVSASDPDGDVLTYAITAGNTGTAFAINGSGQISVNNTAALDFEATPSFTLTVTVSDGTFSDDAVITINLNDVNEVPTATDATVSLNENSSNGTAVHVVSATDPDGNVLTYAITAGNTGTAFAINGSGQISVNNAAALDFEATPSFSLTVRVSDGSLFDDAVITINLNDVNETPPVVNNAPVAIDATVTLNENSFNGATVYAVSASDPDGDVLTYAITAGNTSTAFAINSSGQIAVSNTAALDFEMTPAFSLAVRVSDGSLYDDAVITINVIDVNEAPHIADAAIRIATDVPDGTRVHQFVSDDPDANDIAVFSIVSGNFNSVFNINENTGELFINTTALPVHPVNSTFELTVMVTDGGGLSAPAKLTIELEAVEEKHVIEPLKGFSPNGDGDNDFWMIRGIEAFPDNVVKVFNRWGNLVFETRHYDNDQIAWRGDAGKGVPETTYFYLITVRGLQPITGYVMMKN